HDSNVLDLSRADRGKVGDASAFDRHGLHSADDLILRPALSLSWERNLFRRRTSTFELGLRADMHRENPRLDEQQWSFTYGQELGKERRASMHRISLR